ncbi:MAG TPA: MFS transporter [Candidatus Acidoferrales bacterium]|jgi:MFS family permease
MAASSRSGFPWRQLFSNAGFTCYFAGMFVSLFGTGMNFAGVTLFVLGKTHSTVQVSFTVILLTLPRLVVPPFGGVLTDRVDRRYLSIALDLARAAIVLLTAVLAWQGRLELWQLYGMVLLLGAGFAIYWSSSLALLQELIPPAQLVSANSAVLIAVQGGMLAAGALVGFVYERAGLAGILAIDGLTYVLSALFFSLLRSGYFRPHDLAAPVGALGNGPGFAIETPAGMASGINRAPVLILESMEPSPARGVLSDIEEGLHYLYAQPAVLALGLTYACMMAGVISANVVVVALANDLLHVGARGYGFIQAGWALGAVTGGLSAGALSQRHPFRVLIAALFVLACGHALFPYAGFLVVAVAMNVLFGACRAIVAVLTQSSILAVVPARLMGRTQSAFAVIATVLQVLMSLALGWLAQHSGLQVAFLLLGLLYASAVVAAMRARGLRTLPVKQAPAT